MLQNILKKIESKRYPKKIFWIFLVSAKDFLFAGKEMIGRLLSGHPFFICSLKTKLLGKPFIIFDGNTFDEGMYYFESIRRQIIEANQYHVELIKEGDIVIDAGAHSGIFSIFAASKYKNATIFAFEPTPFTFKVLKKIPGSIRISRLLITDLERQTKKRLLYLLAGLLIAILLVRVAFLLRLKQ